jgi:GntR family transcriptional regulator
MITLRIDAHSGLPPYLQIVQQVRRALRLGMLQVGDQLPTIKQVAAGVAINPNTVVKAYRELEYAGLIESRPGLGTFIVKTLEGPSLESQAVLRRSLLRWLREAGAAGLDEEGIQAIFLDALHESMREGVA